MKLNGELSKVSLPNLVQLVKNGELTGKITLMQGARSASLFVEQGDVVHVDIDGFSGREAFFELFLWMTGSFSFIEGELGSAPRTLNPSEPEDSLDRLLREGLSYLEQKKYLEQLRITGDTVLSMTDRIRELTAQAKSNVRLAAALKMISPITQRIDGETPLGVALKDLQLSRRSYAQSLAIILAEGLAVVVEKPVTEKGESIDLPAWVIARLKQDDTDLTQSIIDMVIWVDRVKCWMYQADVDFARILENLTGTAPAMWHDDEFFRELNSGALDYQGPLFGESAVPEPSTSSKPANPTVPSQLPPASRATNAPQGNQTAPAAPTAPNPSPATLSNPSPAASASPASVAPSAPVASRAPAAPAGTTSSAAPAAVAPQVKSISITGPASPSAPGAPVITTVKAASQSQAARKPAAADSITPVAAPTDPNSIDAANSKTRNQKDQTAKSVEF
jgi:hypothetical protein